MTDTLPLARFRAAHAVHGVHGFTHTAFQPHAPATPRHAQILGTLDQGRGQLLVYEPTTLDKTFEYGLEVISNMGLVVDSLFRRAQRLATHSHVVGSGASPAAVAAAAAAPAAASS